MIYALLIFWASTTPNGIAAVNAGQFVSHAACISAAQQVKTQAVADGQGVKTLCVGVDR